MLPVTKRTFEKTLRGVVKRFGLILTKEEQAQLRPAYRVRARPGPRLRGVRDAHLRRAGEPQGADQELRASSDSRPGMSQRSSGS